MDEIENMLAFISAWPSMQIPDTVVHGQVGLKLVEFFANWHIESPT